MANSSIWIALEAQSIAELELPERPSQTDVAQGEACEPSVGELTFRVGWFSQADESQPVPKGQCSPLGHRRPSLLAFKPGAHPRRRAPAGVVACTRTFPAGR